MFVERHEYVVEFEKYARLITENYGIEIRFDGTEAKTDGNTIYLPNVEGMEEDEVEFLYCIVLHEVGHIRHTDFDEKLFAQIKTHDHFGIINSIEDARIENAMMKDFDGADAIFDDLYNRYACSDKYMKRVFKADTKQTGLWYNFCILVHDYLLDIPTNHKIVKGKHKAEAQKMFGQVLDKLDNAVLRNTKDVFKLGTELYDFFYANSEDKSEKITIAEDKKKIEEAKKKIEELKKQLLDMMEKHKAIRKTNRELRKEKKQLLEDRDKFYEEHKDVLTKADKDTCRANDYLYDRRYLEEAKNDLHKAQVNQLKKAQQINKQKDLLKRMDEQMENLKDKIARARNQETKQKYEDQLQKKYDRQERLEERIQNNEERYQNYKEDEKWAKQCRDDHQEAVDKQDGNLTDEQLKQMAKESQQTASPIRNEMHEKFDKKIGDLQEQIRNNNRQIKQEVQQQVPKTMGEMNKVGKEMDKAGLGEECGLSPQFDEDSEWTDGDQVQKEFDKKATQQTGQPVANGMSPFGSNVREILTHLEKGNENLNHIDLSEIFKAKNKVSRLDQLNDAESEINNTRIADDVDTYKSTRRHIPLTTDYDVVREEVAGKNVEAPKIKKEKAKEIAGLTAVLKAKFRFKKKHKFRGNQEEGSLDPRDVWRIPKGLGTQIFEQVEKKFENKVQVSVALDISGSMDKDMTEYGKKIREFAVVFDEALTNSHVKHEVIGYGAPVCGQMASKSASPTFNRTKNNLETVVYRNIKGRACLDNIEPKCWDNVDGESLRVMAKRMMKNRAKKKVFFILTDGKPFTADADLGVLDQDLRNTLIWLKKNDIEVYAFGFNDQGKEFYGDHYHKIEDFNSVSRFLKDKLTMVK